MKLVKIIHLILAFYLLSFSSIAQLSLGKATLLMAKAIPISTTTSIAAGLRTAGYVSHIGGVAFDKVAIPADSLHIANFGFGYDASQPDGHRLSVSINGHAAYGDIPDWELIPIAKYANSPVTGCFTLFGQLENSMLEDSMRDKGGRILNYHPALENTLLGLRLFQLDILIVYPELTVDLPKDGGKYLLGLGEQTPDTNAGGQGFQLFDSALNSVNEQYQSYLICDTNRTIQFGVAGDSLRIDGEPYVYFFKFGSSNDMELYLIEDSIYHKANLVRAQGQTSQQKNALVEKWLLRNIRKQFQHLDSVRGQDQYEKFLAAEKNYEAFEGVKDYIHDLEVALAELILRQSPPIYLPEMSTSLSERLDLFRNINPAVWDAGVTTMKLSAFFRYCKANYPEQWQKFLDTINSMKVLPAVQTPAIMSLN